MVKWLFFFFDCHVRFSWVYLEEYIGIISFLKLVTKVFFFDILLVSLLKKRWGRRWTHFEQIYFRKSFGWLPKKVTTWKIDGWDCIFTNLDGWFIGGCDSVTREHEGFTNMFWKKRPSTSTHPRNLMESFLEPSSGVYPRNHWLSTSMANFCNLRNLFQGGQVLRCKLLVSGREPHVSFTTHLFQVD